MRIAVNMNQQHLGMLIARQQRKICLCHGVSHLQGGADAGDVTMLHARKADVVFRHPITPHSCCCIVPARDLPDLLRHLLGGLHA